MANFFKNQFELFVNAKFNGNWAEAARQSGVAATTLQSIKEGTKPREDTIYRIATAFGLSCDWLLTGEGPMHRTEVATHPPVDRSQIIVSDIDLKSMAPDLHTKALVHVQKYDISAAAGAGCVSEYAKEDGLMAFDEDWLVREMKLVPEKSAVIKVHGDSMAPTLSNGDFVLIDMRDVESFSRDAVYAFNIDGSLYVKRIQRKGRRFEILSDNPQYETWTPDIAELETLRIIGRVVLAGKWM
ncbi:MAG: helix-turn-helix transcriptional regulator [Magnetococcales bacterium]|nr:helix-turn-helix transcriptional regulator [Magnetococcales bacterium]